MSRSAADALLVSPPLERPRAAALLTFLRVRLPDAVDQARHQLSAHRLRTGLALLGIVVGVAGCVASMAVMEGLEGVHLAFWQRLGGDRAGIVQTPDSVNKAGRRTPLPKVYPLRVDDLGYLMEAVAGIEVATPAFGSNLPVRSPRASLQQVNVVFAGSSLLRIRPFQLRSGRFFTEEESRKGARVAVAFAGITESLFGTDDPLGREILVDGQRVTIVGVLRPVVDGGGPRLVYMPFGTGLARYGLATVVWNAWIKLRPGASRPENGEAVREALVRRNPGASPDNFRIRWLGDWQDRGTQEIRAQGQVLISVAVLCLLAGGVGILNVFLISVNERTNEIGLRMALGASRGAVMAQILFESLCVCSLGGALGLALGQGGAVLFREVLLRLGSSGSEIASDLSVSVGWSGALTALGMTFLMAVVFGSFPAWRASRLMPAESLRHE